MKLLGTTKAPLCHHHEMNYLEDSNALEKIQYPATKSTKKDLIYCTPLLLLKRDSTTQFAMTPDLFP